MRRASSLFEIDQEPLFEPLALETEADGERDWDDALDELPAALELSDARVADELHRLQPSARRRSLLLVAVAAVGAVGFLGSRLTQVAETPSGPPLSAPDLSAVVEVGQPSPPVRRGETTRLRGAHAHRESQRGRAPRERHGSRATGRPSRRRQTTSPSRSLVPVPAPVPIRPARPAQAPAPEPQGFTGEFF